MEKSFKLNENPLTTGLDLTTVKLIEEKADGSLISTYLTGDAQLCIKTKGSIGSSQVLNAQKLVNDNQYFCSRFSS